MVWRKGHRKVTFWWEWGGKRIAVCRALKRKDASGWPWASMLAHELIPFGWGKHRKGREGGTTDMSMGL